MTKKKLISLILAAVIFCTSLAACAKKEQSNKEKYSDSFFDAFDTVITITAYCNNQEEFDVLFATAKEEFLRLHKLFDIYNEYDGIVNLKLVNDKAGTEAVTVDSDIISLLEYSKEMYAYTNGKMNIAMGSVLKYWHDAREKANAGETSESILPTFDVLSEANKHTNIDNLKLDSVNSTVEFLDPLLKLDVGAIAKGWATERVAEKLTYLGYESILINAGGNVKTTGAKPNGDLWMIGIQDPKIGGGEGYTATISIDAKSVVTSGVYERYFTVNEVSYHHIIDPITLYPEHRYQSVSIVTSDAGTADALSTAVFNMDINEGKAYIESLSDVEAMWILNDMTCVYSSGYEKLISK